MCFLCSEWCSNSVINTQTSTSVRWTDVYVPEAIVATHPGVSSVFVQLAIATTQRLVPVKVFCSVDRLNV